MRKVLLSWILVSIVFISNSLAQEWEEIQIVSPPIDGLTEESNYGTSVSIDQNYAVVGTPGYSDDTGCVYVLFYDQNEWKTVARLFASNGEKNHRFGCAVSISGDDIVIGASNISLNDYRYGYAYVFTKPESGWENMTETAILTPSDHEMTDEFGFSVDILNNTVVVGAPSDENNINENGSIYIFEKSTGGWESGNEIAKLTCQVYGIGDVGTDVSITKNFIVGGSDNGYVLVYNRPVSGWSNSTEDAVLTPSDGFTNDGFGSVIDAIDNCIVAGARGDNDNGLYSGSVYIYQKSAGGWEDMNESLKILASNGSERQLYGTSVKLNNNRLIVGANAEWGTGAAYLYKRESDNWTDVEEEMVYTMPYSKRYYRFGNSVGISGKNIIVGAPFDSELGLRIGSAYFFKQKSNYEYNSNLCEDEDFLYSISNQEAGATYQWQANTEGLWQNIDGETNDTLLIQNVTLDMTGNMYRCIISATENDTSDVATLTINPTYNLTETVSINSGESYTFSDGTTQDDITAQVVYTSNLETTLGCDSIIETTVNVEDNSGSLFAKTDIHFYTHNTQSNMNWGDYDNDGDIDILLAGTFIGDTSLNVKILVNENNSFAINTEITMPYTWHYNIDWADINNDGDLDLFLAGEAMMDNQGNWDPKSFIKVFMNEGDYFYEANNSTFDDFSQVSSSTWGDYNNDGEIDVLLMGEIAYSGKTILYKNLYHGYVKAYDDKFIDSNYGNASWGDYDNDGDLDLLINGRSNYKPAISLYENVEGDFVQVNANIDTLASASGWIDFNNDGFLDIIISGTVDSDSVVTKLYKNTGSGFIDFPVKGFENRLLSSFDLGDIDNDGDVDIIGQWYNEDDSSFVQIFRNDLTDFVPITEEVFESFEYGNIKCVDYDKDGDVDFMINGELEGYDYFALYKNTTTTANQKASQPNSLLSAVADKNVILKWNKTTDAETPQDGLSYNIEVYKNNSKRKLQTLYTKIKRIQYCENGYTLKNLPEGQYYWKVQAFDTGLQGGDFSEEKSFIIGENSGGTYYESESICEGETYAFGTQELSTAGEYTEIFQAVDGSDSTVVLTIIVNPIYNLSETIVICSGENYTFPDGTVLNNITTQIIHTSNLQTIFGCDSIIETTVNIEQPAICYFYETVTICSGSDYEFPDGTVQSNITSKVVYESIIPSSFACDTIIETTVNVNQGEVTYLTDTICKGESIQLAYIILSYPGMYGVRLTNRFGCDSLVYLDLSVANPIVNLGPDAIINLNDSIILDAGENFETYYWNTDETSQTILFNGSVGVGIYNFSVYVTDQIGCSATDTILITVNDLTDIISIDDLENNIKIYPNPTSGKLNIEWFENNEEVEISIFDITGKLLLQKELNSKETKMLLDIPGDSGVYFIRVSTKANTNTFKIIKN